MRQYYRPIICAEQTRPKNALALAGRDDLWWAQAELIMRGAKRVLVSAQDVPEEWRNAISAPRRDLLGISLKRAAVMGIVNVTPDSFSDGGQFEGATTAVAHGQQLLADGADILDIGGESTRPGAKTVAIAEEIARVVPVISGIQHAAPSAVISIDSRKSDVAAAALDAGAGIINDVGAGLYDPLIVALAAKRNAPICVMHAQGQPENMQDDPRYDDVLLEIYDFLAQRIDALTKAGVQREKIIVDPGIGFGKTQTHNLLILRDISLFHGLGVPVLLGASRKRFIGAISGVDGAEQRLAGSLSVSLWGASQGIQIHRVHDVAQTVQAFALQRAIQAGA